jgi:hypothetical protein
MKARHIRTMQTFAAAAIGMALTCVTTQAASTTPTSGTLYFTTFSGADRVHDVSFNFNGSSFGLGSVVNIAGGNGIGADGLVFTADNNLAVGGQGNAVYKVDPNGVNPTTSVTAGGTSAYHMMVSPNGTIWSSGIPGTPASYNANLTVNGTPHPIVNVTGAGVSLDTISWNTADPTKAFYTSSGSGGNGTFGRLDLSTFVATPLLTSLPAAHGMIFDAYTGDLILFGANHVTQIDPITGLVVHDATLSGSETFDQGTSDGKGHLYIASNSGDLLFLDISTSMNVAAPDFSSTQFLASSLDDVAPLSGGGSQTVPDTGSTALLLFLSVLGLGALRPRFSQVGFSTPC